MMNKYEKYKDSGISWIGKIPQDWEVAKLKFCLNSSFAGVWGEDVKQNENDVRCFRVADFDYNKLGLSNNNPTKRNIDKNVYNQRQVFQNDILLEKSGGGDKTPVGRAVYVNIKENAICSNFVHCIRANNNTVSKFLVYMFSVMYDRKINLLYFNQTTGIQNLNVSDYLNNTVCIPCYDEQQAIADFLDVKCAEVDELIALQGKMIDELKVYKQSVITEAVIKGLNTDAPLKDSGIEWIGQIPQHWEVRKLKWLFNLRTGTTPCNFENIEEYENRVYWFTPVDIKEDGCELYYSERTLSENVIKEHNIKLFPIHSLICVGIGASAGKVGFSNVEGYSNQQITALIANNNIISKYYYYYLLIDKKRIRDNAFYTTLPILNNSYLSQIYTLFPSVQNQQAIADFLDVKCAEIDEMTSIKQQKIEQLKEYKKSIIYEYVTGKKQVI